MKYKHLLRLNRGRTDKNIYFIWTGTARANNYIMWTGAARKTTKSKLTQRKIPRGRSKTNHQLKFQHQQIFRTIEDLNSTKEKLYQQNFNDQTPHQLAKRCQHNSEESIKMSKEYYMNYIRKSTFKIQPNAKAPNIWKRQQIE